MKKFNTPVLILWGRQDTNFGPQIATRLAKDIPGVTGLHWMKRSAHLPMLEEPEVYNNAALSFFNTGDVANEARIALAEARQQ
jgi:pimeloyl-ACP methyl ester carboxylesterase